MTQDEIIELASKVYGTKDFHESALFHLEAFAKLVEAKVSDKEREACAKDAEWCIQNYIEQHIPERIRARGSSFAATSND